ncbi:MAG TPA: hypothetical protein VHN15_02465, partial [Thermoanaerobaculia bacterium]|nr:hypothetical protein [Thermoanaerobaculia bacterium]
MNPRRFVNLFILLSAITLAALPAEAGQFIVSGTLLYEDGDPLPTLGLATSFSRPARLVRITVEDDDEDVFGQGHTDSAGRFQIAVRAPDDEPLRVLAEVDNFALELFANTDGWNDRFRLLIDDLPAGHASDVALGTLPVAARYHAVRIHEALPVLPLDVLSYDTVLSFAAALNVNETILQAHAIAETNRDPGETDTIGQVTVEYCDPVASRYFLDMVLSCARIDGAVNPENPSGLDQAFVDTTVAHEYAHHLQYEVGAWDGHWEDHDNCVENDSILNNDPEIAWSEGFADFFAEHVVTQGDRLSKKEQTIAGNVEAGCQSPVFVSGDDERFLAVEGNVIAALWDLTDGLGTGLDSWDRVGGTVDGGRGFRSIFQIFDNELDTWDAPDLIDFYDAVASRPGVV